MIFDMHVGGPDNPGQIRYQDENKQWKSLAVPEIYWVFESDHPFKHAQFKDDAPKPYKTGDMRKITLVDSHRKVYEFILAQEQAEQLMADLHQANPHIILQALKGDRLPLQMLQNCRDLGGIKTKENRLILAHKLLRSDALHGANRHDKEILEKEYGLKTVIDFRTTPERFEQPDPLWLGVHHIHDPAFDIKLAEQDLDSDDASLLHLVQAGPQFLVDLYSQMASKLESIVAWKKFFEVLLADPKGAILWHCTQGKDRTGIASVLLLQALGVDWKQIMADYERSSEYLQAQCDEQIHRLIEQTGKSEEELANVKAFYQARPEYLNTFVSKACQMAGSLDGYLEKVLNLDAQKIEDLKTLYLTEPRAK